MKKLQTIAMFCLVLLLGGCGGGDGDAPASTTSPNSSAASTLDDLTASPGTIASSQSTRLCGIDVGANALRGTVTGVHDGDTLTLGTSEGGIYKVRLDSIDAPELDQPFGSSSQVALSSAVLGKYVEVTYSKKDHYGRIVGAVFDSNCAYVNLSQVATGMAWFYKAYQCEISATVRGQFAQAQDAAMTMKIGLWSQGDPVEPWVYRNGVNPVAPTCTGAAASWPGSPNTSTVSTYTPVNTCTKVWVNSYVRSNGTYVSGYWRNSPGCA